MSYTYYQYFRVHFKGPTQKMVIQHLKSTFFQLRRPYYAVLTYKFTQHRYLGLLSMLQSSDLHLLMPTLVFFQSMSLCKRGQTLQKSLYQNWRYLWRFEWSVFFLKKIIEAPISFLKLCSLPKLWVCSCVSALLMKSLTKRDTNLFPLMR